MLYYQGKGRMGGKKADPSCLQSTSDDQTVAPNLLAIKHFSCGPGLIVLFSPLHLCVGLCASLEP